MLAVAIAAIASQVPSAFGALNASIVWEARQAGSANNGGGFRNNPFFAAPSAPSITPSASGGTIAAGTYYCVLTYSPSLGGETVISGQTTVTLTGTTSSFVVTHPTDPGNSATWSLYVGTTSGGPYFPQGTALTIGGNRSVTSTPPTSGTQPAGTDRTLSTSPFVAVDNAAITATTAGAGSNVLTFTAGYTPTGADVGNIFHATAGTNINAGFYEITAITSTTWTVTGSGNLTTGGGAGSAIVGNMGGAVDHPATITGVAVAGNTVFIKYSATAFTCSASTNVSGGSISMFSGFTNFVFQGYDTTRAINNTNANRPIFRPSANSVMAFNIANCPTQINNLSFDNPSVFTTFQGINHQSNGGSVSRCKFNGCTSTSLAMTSAGGKAWDCEVVAGVMNGVHLSLGAGCSARRCIVRSCTGTTATAIGSSAFGATCEECIAYSNTGTGIDLGANYGRTLNCVAYGSTGVGIMLSGGSSAELCIAYGNGTYGFSLTGGTSDLKALVQNCAAGNNSTNNTHPVFASHQLVNLQALSGDPFTNAAGLDFSINATAGAGALCRSITVALPGGTTTGFPDAGAAQHTNPSGGGGFRPRPRTSFNLLPESIPMPQRVLPAASDREWRKAG